ncbi:MAG: restriction endonuclease subunit S [Bacteroidales bacterium]|nr:restriction endonuclease subunit S [Bacteroidales bacterium]
MKFEPFENIFRDSTSNYTKVKKEDYKTTGKFPIVDQGQSFIGGYTDDEKIVVKENLPVIVFGDHTKAFKYIDFPFTIGADGVKVLTLKNDEYNVLYYYYFLKSISIVDKGYSRHFKYLKEKKLPVPDRVRDQLHIANVLIKAENLIAQRKESIRLLDEFLKSTFLEMFGDPGINPKKWPVKKLEEYIEYMGDIGSNGSNEMVAKNLEMLDVEDYAIMIRTTNLTKNDFTNNIKYVTQKTYDFFKKSKIYGGEIIMNKIGSAGDFWLMPKLNRPVTLGLNQLVIRPKNLPTLYLFHYLSTDYGRMIVKAQAKGATTKSITKTAVKALPLMCPPVELQNKFVSIVEKTEALKSQYKKSLQELENLYGSLSQKAFRGELSLKDESLLSSVEPVEVRDLHPLKK